MRSLLFQAAAPAYSLDGRLTIGSGGITLNSSSTQFLRVIGLSSAHTWNAAAGNLNLDYLELNAKNLTIDGSFDTTINHSIIGPDSSGSNTRAGSIHKIGSGRLTLGGTGENGSAASLVIDGGSVVVTNQKALTLTVVTLNTDNSLTSSGPMEVGGLTGTGALSVFDIRVTAPVDSSYAGRLTNNTLYQNGSKTLTLTGGTAAAPSNLAYVSGRVTFDNAYAVLSLSLTGASVIHGAVIEVPNSASVSNVLVSGANSRIFSHRRLVLTSTTLEDGATVQAAEGISLSSVTSNGCPITAPTVSSNSTSLFTGAGAEIIASTFDGGGTFADGARVDCDKAQISGLLLQPGGSLNVSDTATCNGPLTIAGGAANVSGALNITNSSSVLDLQQGTLTLGALTGSGHIKVGKTIAFTMGGNNQSTTFGGSFEDGSSGAGAFRKVGTGNLTLTGASTFTGRVRLEGGAITLNGGTARSSFTANAGTTLNLQGGTGLTLGLNDIVANGSARYDNASVTGGFLRGTGHWIRSGGASFDGTTATTSARIRQDGATSMTRFINRGRIDSNAPLTLVDSINASEGIINVNSLVEATEFSDSGVMNISPTGKLEMVDSPLVLGAGSRTYVGTAALPGGEIDLNGQTLELNSGLLVNNGTIGGGLVNINFGSLAIGAGSYEGGYAVNQGGRIVFGNTPGVVNSGDATLGEGGSFDFQINDAEGVAGTNWDLNEIEGLLNVTAGTTLMSSFRISLNSLTIDNRQGKISNFDPDEAYRWMFATTTTGVTGLNPAKFSVDTSNFLNPLNGSFTVGITSSGMGLELRYNPVPEPGTYAAFALGALVLFRRRRRVQA